MARMIHVITAREAVEEVLVRLEADAERLSVAALPASLLLAPLLLLWAPLLWGLLLLGWLWGLPRRGHSPLHRRCTAGLLWCPCLLSHTVAR